MIGGPIGWPIGGFIGDGQGPPIPPTPPVAVTTTGDPGGHRRRLLQELDRDQRQREFDRRGGAPEPAPDIGDVHPGTGSAEAHPAGVIQRKPPQLGRSPLPLVANFGAGPVTIGIKPSLENEILADDEDAIMAILLALN